MLYFKKESIRNPVFGPDKKAIPFELLPGDLGVKSVDEVADKPTADTLSAYASNRQGGVVKISSEIYESLKKNAASTPSPQRSSFLNQIRTSPSPLSFNERVVPAAQPAAVAKGGITIMDEPAPPSSIAQFRQTAIRSRPATPAPQANKPQ